MMEEAPYNPKFFRLLDAVLMEPSKVSSMVKDQPGIREEKNPAGETALHWLVIENKLEEVRFLRSLGAKIPAYSLLHAAQMGYTEMVITLLELGADPSGLGILEAIRNPVWKLPKKKIRLIESYLKQYEYET